MSEQAKFAVLHAVVSYIHCQNVTSPGDIAAKHSLTLTLRALTSVQLSQNPKTYGEKK
jgi:hypothetical protein